ncbi:DUF4817 domain-containing protein [Trichonephila clavipes]|nr:DUF4817 domain-containing protein [Trichonephila clavipes]
MREAPFSLHGDVNSHNCRIWATSNPREYTQKPLHSPKVTAWCSYTGSFIIGPFFFETQCPVNGWITETVNAQRYLTLLWKTVVPCLIQRGQISNVTFMQDGATSHTANPVKALLIQTFEEDRIVSRRCRYPWPHRSPDLTPADFWLWGYLKSHVYLSGPSSLSELKDAIRREVSSIHPDMLHSAVAGFVTRLKNSLVNVALYHIHHIWHYRVRLRESGQPIGRLRKTCKNAFPRTIPVRFGRLDTPIATESSLKSRRFRSGSFDVKDAPRTDKLVVENVDKITEIIEVDRRVSSHSIAHLLKIDLKHRFKPFVQSLIKKEARCLGATPINIQKLDGSNFNQRNLG